MTLRVATWSLAQIAAAVSGTIAAEHANLRVTGVSTDTRSMTPDALFVALVGDRFDGHDYAAAAVDGGARAVMVSRELAEIRAPQIIVDDTLEALQQLGAALFRAAQSEGLRSIALTGSNGKTTTKELCAALCSTRGRTHFTAGNLNNHIGVPLTLCALPLDAEFAVVEMGANAPGDIAELIELAPTDVRVITSIGAAHLEGFGDVDGVREAKSEIFGGAPARLAVYPSTESFATSSPTLTVGPRGSGADVGWSRDAAGVNVRGPDFELHSRLALPGAHNAQNLATAVAAVRGAAGELDPERANEALEALQLPQGRWRRVQRGRWSFLDDAYNANPSSVRASWDAFVEIAEASGAVASDVVAVVGEMYELGEDAEELHRDTARWVAQRGGAGTFVFVGRFAQAMAEAAASSSSVRVVAFASPEEAAQWLRQRDPSTVYLKASRGQRLETIIDDVTS